MYIYIRGGKRRTGEGKKLEGEHKNLELLFLFPFFKEKNLRRHVEDKGREKLYYQNKGNVIINLNFILMSVTHKE